MKKILWRAAVIVPLLGLMVAVPLKTNLFKTKVDATSLNPLAKAEFEHNRDAVDNSAAGSQSTPSEIPAQAPVVEVNAPAVESAISYCIITGSFRIRQNAETQASILAKQGYVPEIIESPNGFYRVSAAKCPDISCAENKRDSIADKFPGSWVKKIN